MIRSSLLHRPGSVTIIGQLQIVVHIWIKIFLKSHLYFSATVISQQILLCIALGHFEMSPSIIQFQMRVHNRFGPIVLSIVINKPIHRQTIGLHSVPLFIVLLTILFHFKIADTSRWVESLCGGTFSYTPQLTLHYFFNFCTIDVRKFHRYFEEA